MPIVINQDMIDALTGDDLLLGNSEWDGPTITYSFDVDPGTLLDEILSTIGLGSFSPDRQTMQQSEKTSLVRMITLWDDLIAPSFVYIQNDDDTDITFNRVTNLPAGFAGLTYTTFSNLLLPNDADVFLLPRDITLGTQTWIAALHEIGHALSLNHSGGYNISDNPPPTYADDAEFPQDTVLYSIMSYFAPNSDNPRINWNIVQPLTPMIYDILAIQSIYGTDMTTRTDDTTYGFNSTPLNADDGKFNAIFRFDPSTATVFTIWDAGGRDRIDAWDYNANQVIDLNAGSYSNIGGLVSNIGIAFGTTIEDAIGGRGNDILRGNLVDNQLTGNDGKDILFGQLGSDLLDGGQRNDTLHGDGDNDRLIGGAGADRLYGDVGFDLALYTAAGGVSVTIASIGGKSQGRWSVTGFSEAEGDQLEGIEGFGFGAGNDTIRGTGGFDFYLDGNGGNDRIVTGSGNDTLVGGAGTDVLNPGTGVFLVYGAASGSDGVTTAETLAQNDLLIFDRGRQTAGYQLDWAEIFGGVGRFRGSDGSLAYGVARIDYTGGTTEDRVFGGRGGDQIDGRQGSDYLWGGDGNDTILGGSDADLLYGGTGNDRIETGGGGDNYVFGGDGRDSLIGSADRELMTGDLDNDLLRGLGGNDYLDGADGNDTIDGGTGNDEILSGRGVESINGGDGYDTLQMDRRDTADSLTLILNGTSSDGTRLQDIESLYYRGGSGQETVRGGADWDIIEGGAGNDSLDGQGGSDTLRGGEGNDLIDGGTGPDYGYGDGGDDTIKGGSDADLLYGGVGNDRLETGGGGDNYVYGGDGNDSLIGSLDAEQFTGDLGNDLLRGFGGNDTLNGNEDSDILDGGAGDDIMDGGAGLDSFIFADGAGNDQINGFDADAVDGQDRLDVSAYTYRNYSAMLADGVTITSVSQGTLIAFGIDRPVVLLAGVLTTTISGADFIF